MKDVEEAFQSTSEIILGKKLVGLATYRDWLLENVRRAIKTKSEVSNNFVYVPAIVFFQAIKRNMVTLEESKELGKKKISMEELKDFTLKNASKKLKGVKYVTSDVKMGQNSNMQESSTYMHAQHCLDGVWYIYSKFDAYCFWPRETEYSFGCDYLFASKFCIKSYNSVKLTRCFEVSDSNNSSDCYFCHNIENCTNCMFCFDAKSLTYAIGNIEVGREKFMEIKNKIMSEVVAELEQNKRLDLNIYNFGCWKRK